MQKSWAWETFQNIKNIADLKLLTDSMCHVHVHLREHDY